MCPFLQTYFSIVSIFTKTTKTWQKRIHWFLQPFCISRYPRNCSILFQRLADVLSHTQGSPLSLPLLLQPPPQARWLPKPSVSPGAPGVPFPSALSSLQRYNPVMTPWGPWRLQSCTTNKKDVKFTVMSAVWCKHIPWTCSASAVPFVVQWQE